MSEGKTEASIYQQAEDGKTELSLMHFAITNPQWQPPRETTHFISQLKERVHREATGTSTETHPLSISESEVRCNTHVTGQENTFLLTFQWLKECLLSHLWLFVTPSATKSHCKPSWWPLDAGIHSFLQGRLPDQSHSSWHNRWGVRATLSIPTYQQCPAKGESECSSQACRSQFSHEQNTDRLWVGNFSFFLWVTGFQ